MYVSNSSISKTDGYLCYHHEGSGLPLAYQDVNCNHLGQHVIIYNERNKSVNYPDTWENKFSIIELCKERIYGKYTYLSVVFKYGQRAYSDSYLKIVKKLRILKCSYKFQCS